MSDRKKPTREQLDAAMMRAHAMFARRANLTGVDVGYRYIKGERTNELCIRVHVERKLPLATIPESEVFPSEISGIPLDVIEGPYRVSRATTGADHRNRQTHLVGGVSCSRADFSAGTLGAIVIDNRSGRPAILSNWHVMAGAEARLGDPILQPGGLDGGVPVRDEIANLDRWILERAGDAAVAALNGARGWLPVQFGSFATLNGQVRDSKLGEILVKSGRTTAQTKARVDGEGLYRIHYDVRPGVREPRDIRGFKLVPEKHCNPDNVEISSGGDSGSVWYHAASGDSVGLHFAGETDPDPTAENAIACNLTEVCEKLDIRIATMMDLLSDGAEEAEVATAPELTPVPDWPWPTFPWPWPPYTPSGGWPYPIPPQPFPFEPPVIRDPFGPRPLPPGFDRFGRGGLGSRAGIGLESSTITPAELRALVLEVIFQALERDYTYGRRSPSSYFPNTGVWRAFYRADIEKPLMKDSRLSVWTVGLDDPTLNALFGKTFDEIYPVLLKDIADSIGVDPWEGLAQ